ncbi:uncharacterized protein LOC131933791 [Physella acuta]|uniref:uncharacterized protein LOC131933791 n=1 Tax=Physella acuta TaxID=109671 RepID=UPI0027DB48E3|nr:uncharacterized protein LOC131933791 [Physella acuta]
MDHRNVVKTLPVDILELANDLRAKLALAHHVTDIDNITSRCQQLGILYPGECNATVSGERCLHAAIPDDVITRVEHLVLNKRLQVPETYLRAIQNLTDQLDRDYDVIIIGATSSNHFQEFQAGHSAAHTISLYAQFTGRPLGNIRYRVERRGKEASRKTLCTVIKLNFDEFPPHFTTFKCFGWKPVIIKAVFARADIVIWADASVRFTVPEVLSDMIAKAKLQGVVQRRPKFNISNPYFTIPQMFEYFGDSPCAHLPFDQVESGFGIYHREPLIEKALIDPWVACALRPECTCPEQQRALQKCPQQWDPLKFGHCMRNDQSSLTIILAKLFREKLFHFVIHTDGLVNIRRGDHLDYFKMLDREMQARTNRSNL